MDDVIFSLKEGFNILLKILIASGIVTVIIFINFLRNYYVYSVKQAIISGFKSDLKKKSKPEKEDDTGLGLFLLRTFILTFLGISAFLLFYSAFIECYKGIIKFFTENLYYDQWFLIFKIIFVITLLGLSIFCFYSLYNFVNKILKKTGLTK